MKKVPILLLILLCLCVGGAQSVSAYSYVKPSKAAVKTTAKKPGWKKKKGKYYFYDSTRRLVKGRFKYKGNYYYCGKDGRRITGWVEHKGNTYFYHKKTGAMIRGRWATDGKYYYYFQSNGVMATNKWIGDHYVNKKGRRVKPGKGKPVITQKGDHYTYTTNTIKINLKRKSVHKVPYWTAHVKIKNSSQLKSALSYGTYGGTRQTTSSAVSSNRGVIGINGSAFDYGTGKPSPLGMCIKNGKIYGDYMTSYSVMAVKKDGTIYTPKQGLMGKDLLKAGVKDTYNFGPVLIKDGQPQLPWAETNKYYPRTAIGMVRPGEYVLLVTDTGNYNGLNHWDMVKIFQSFGCQYAYNLDGGGSSTLYFNGKVMNKLINNYERPCGDFLYFTK